MTRHIIVVGAGAAGVPLAVRLSDDPRFSVTLIDAGDAGPTPADLQDGGRLAGASPTHPDTLVYEANLSARRTHTVVRGRRFGGSTATNGGYFMRATAEDFHRWAAIGGPTWSYDHALPLLDKIEHSFMPVTLTPQSAPAAQAFHAAAVELGFREEPNKNAGAPPGVGPVPTNIANGVRIHTAMAYLARERPNLRILDNTRATRVLFDAVDGRDPLATGVLTDRGRLEGDEVVLTAGAIETAKLLLLSGVGPAGDLTKLGISPLKDVPVGRALSDHPNLVLEWQATRPIVDWNAGYSFSTALHVDASVVDPTLTPSPQGDLEILLAAKPLGFLLTGVADAGDTLQALVALQNHRGRGQLSLTSADPDAPPRIDYQYFADAEDLQRMRAAVRTAVRLFHTRAFSPLFDRFTNINVDDIAHDASLNDWILAHHGTALHSCSTAPMGAVTDGSGRVHGITGLRVADTSILPAAPHRGPAATAVFIGEHVARRMIDEGSTPE